MNPAFHFDFPKASQCSYHIRITLISILRYLHSWWWLQVRSNVPQPELILPLYDKVENQRGAQYWELRQPDSPNQKVKILAFFCWHYSNSYFSLSPEFSQKIKTDWRRFKNKTCFLICIIPNKTMEEICTSLALHSIWVKFVFL